MPMSDLNGCYMLLTIEPPHRAYMMTVPEVATVPILPIFSSLEAVNQYLADFPPHLAVEPGRIVNARQMLREVSNRVVIALDVHNVGNETHCAFVTPAELSN